jgi:hypothetical protein
MPLLDDDNLRFSCGLLVYIGIMTQSLHAYLFTMFLDVQLAASFAPRFYNNIFKCKRISETGAQQVNLARSI